VPHTFRVVGGPARILLAHANDSFIQAVEELGAERREDDVPTTAGGPAPEELDRLLGAHGITNVGAAMEAEDARRWLDALT
jgi:hypothetical protein